MRTRRDIWIDVGLRFAAGFCLCLAALQAAWLAPAAAQSYAAMFDAQAFRDTAESAIVAAVVFTGAVALLFLL
jgi:hypothetical protein